jgi:hypothetical protein
MMQKLLHDRSTPPRKWPPSRQMTTQAATALICRQASKRHSPTIAYSEEDNGTDDRSQDKSSVHKGQQRTWAQKASVAREAVPEFIIEQPAQSEDDDTNASHSVLAELAASRAEVDMLKQRLAQIEIDSRMEKEQAQRQRCSNKLRKQSKNIFRLSRGIRQILM